MVLRIFKMIATSGFLTALECTKLGMLNDNRKIDYRILLSESLSRFNNRLSKTNDLSTGDLERER